MTIVVDSPFQIITTSISDIRLANSPTMRNLHFSFASGVIFALLATLVISKKDADIYQDIANTALKEATN